MAWAEEIWLQRIWAAWLWAGPVTAISHFAAGALNGLAVEMPSVVHVTIPYRFGPKSSKRWLVVRRLMKEPWLLASSLGEVAGPEIVRRYGRRFTIEESFRDIKDLRFGMGLSATRISKPARRDRLLLLSALSIALLTVLGAAGEAVGIDRHFKVNTSKRRQYSLFAQTLEVI